jgi:hypothetical protein
VRTAAVVDADRTRYGQLAPASRRAAYAVALVTRTEDEATAANGPHGYRFELPNKDVMTRDREMVRVSSPQRRLMYREPCVVVQTATVGVLRARPRATQPDVMKAR